MKKIYSNEVERTKADNTRKARYNAQNNDNVQVWLPKGYNNKLKQIAERQGKSKAQIIKEFIDKEYSAIDGE